MSVIYDALIKRKKNGDKKRESVASQGNVLIFDDLIKKNAVPTLLAFVLVVFAVVGGLYYLYQYDVIPHKIAPALPADHTLLADPVAAQSVADEATESDLVTITKGQQAPAAENIVVAHISTAEIPEEPINFPKEVVTVEENRLRADAVVPKRKAAVETVKNRSVVIEDLAETEVAGHRQEVQSVLIVAPKAGPRPATNINSEIKNTSEPGLQNLQPASGSVNISRNVLPSPKQVANKTLPFSSTEKVSGVAVTPRRQQQKIVPENDKHDFNPAIQNLNRELQQSLERHDFAAGHEIIKKLEGFLGDDSTYILKLKAYFYLRNNQFELAHRLLVRVLENDETDLEAGLNMIVVLVHQGEIKAAQRQNNFLLNYYPDNPSLLLFKQQIGN